MLSHSEFQPGVPWKGVQSPEPEPDPYMSPAGMLGPSVLSDTEHHLLQDNTGTETVSVHVNLASSSDRTTRDDRVIVLCFSPLMENWEFEMLKLNIKI